MLWAPRVGQGLLPRLVLCVSSRPGSSHATPQGFLSILVLWNPFKNSLSCRARGNSHSMFSWNNLVRSS